MAQLEALIFSTLSADTAVKALVASRIYPLILPQKDLVFPAITYQRISGGQEFALEGYAGAQRPRIQVDCWAVDQSKTLKGYNLVKQLAAAVMAAMNAGFNVSAMSDRDLFQEAEPNNIYRVSIDFTVWHKEA